ncbi:MAG: hypothetical protein NTW87_17040 [Planctomycetota bacterium]|nr:hypothetical protein [Planctomycetota bacterium]
MRHHVILGVILLLATPTVFGGEAQMENTEKRRGFLEQLRRVLPQSKAWDEWLAKSGELPPDFDAMPSEHGLPDPLLRDDNGRRVPITDPKEWEARRQQLRSLFHQWVLGTVPPRPGNLQAAVAGEAAEESATVRQVELTFGPERKARLRLELLIPKGNGPFPVFVTQTNHRGWALIALRRGYLCCVYAGCDDRDDTDSFVAAYPQYDWSRLTRRAWAAGRCLDYLETQPLADMKRVALTGHSRNGKLSLIAAALDERFSVVISSSSGAGGALTTRFYCEQQQAEGIEFITRVFPDWFHPRFRFFCGREDKLPVDQHELVALSAPRACLLSIALNDPVESSWAMQQTYLSAQRVYRLLGAENRLRIEWRPGSHETWTATIERFMDWCDTQFGRGTYSFPERLIHPWDWDAWRRQQGELPLPDAAAARALDDALRLNDGSAVRDAAGWTKKQAEVRTAVEWMLGQAPPAALNPGHDYGKEERHIAALLGRSAPPAGIAKEQVVFGEYISADVYLPAGLKESGKKAAAVLWLHPACLRSCHTWTRSACSGWATAWEVSWGSTRARWMSASRALPRYVCRSRSAWTPRSGTRAAWGAGRSSPCWRRGWGVSRERKRACRMTSMSCWRALRRARRWS